MNKNFFLLLFSLFLLTACATDPKEHTAGWDADQLYEEAKKALKDDDYRTAIRYYELLEARHPFGPYAQQALLESIYAYYKHNEPESAIVTADRFIQQYPRHPNIDYVYYMKGLVNFEMNQGLFDRFLPLDKSQRDQTVAMNSFRDFAELLQRFPQSRYAEDAEKRMLYLRNSAAQYELNVAEFYMVRGAYLAAANRAKNVIEGFQRTPAVPDALALMVKAYRILQLDDLANQSLQVLQLNYPNHPKLSELNALHIEG
ncbi:outer membrane protein assembly factor BamD [Thioflexithrix psekupsensis]|uniref:Outer membrane protein assembly factor BamD n=1 Tax=Thioflexithrix psekupsensis TaxID=1570016 RepID=A0A251X6G8_9GAMM|nr:outer membrane protein assembly factor BamD [Thioflexithrix psekupsensis]OUD12527.1 outer membrane protein assembly factor BamD [Thioflexithrix psekupsensis]